MTIELLDTWSYRAHCYSMLRTKSDAPLPLALPRVMPFKRAAIGSGFSYSSLREAHLRGDLAVIRIGRAWYIELAELSRFVAAHTERRSV